MYVSEGKQKNKTRKEPFIRFINSSRSRVDPPSSAPILVVVVGKLHYIDCFPLVSMGSKHMATNEARIKPPLA